MRHLALVVPRTQGERVRKELRARSLLVPELPVLRERESLWFPIRGVPDPPLEGTTTEEREFPASTARLARSYRELTGLSAEAQRRLPRAFDVIGDVVLIRIAPDQEADVSVIGAALLAFVPGARKVGWDRGVYGPARRRRIVPLAGEGSWRTRHRENGIEFEVDPEVAYFSPRLAREHARIAAAARSGERLWDLCCGIGPFSLTVARGGGPREIVAVDANPDAIRLLNENAARLGVAGRLTVRNESIESFLATAGTADRIVFNLPHEGIKYLPSVSAAVRPGGTLHYYEVSPRAAGTDRVEELVRLLSRDSAWRCADHHVVHAYSPAADLVAYTFERA